MRTRAATKKKKKNKLNEQRWTPEQIEHIEKMNVMCKIIRNFEMGIDDK